MVIPKKIHYFWFGGNEKTDLVEKCILSWKKYMPEYEIIEWNEQNYDVHKCSYISQAYENKKWAFVSDYARFDILYQYGGVYLDTDVELLKPIPEEILNSGNAVSGMESSGWVCPGLIFAAWQHHPVCLEMIRSYEAEDFIINGKPNLVTVNKRICGILKPYGFIENNKMQTVMQIDLYPSEVFCGFNQDLGEYAITDKTIAVHHYASSWKRKGLKRKLQRMIKKYLGIDAYQKLLKIKRKLFGVYDK